MSKKNFTIREYKKGDYPYTKRLMEQLTNSVDREFEEDRWKKHISIRLTTGVGGMLMVVDEDDHPFGMAFVEIRTKPTGQYYQHHPRTDKYGYITNVVIDEKHRGLGIGEMLINEGVKQLKKAGIEVIRINIRDDNPEIKKFYEKLGFKKAYTVMEYEAKE